MSAMTYFKNNDHEASVIARSARSKVKAEILLGTKGGSSTQTLKVIQLVIGRKGLDEQIELVTDVPCVKTESAMPNIMNTFNANRKQQQIYVTQQLGNRPHPSTMVVSLEVMTKKSLSRELSQVHATSNEMQTNDL